jgi:uncharacterized repeat protein (TIGR01451 family)
MQQFRNAWPLLALGALAWAVPATAQQAQEPQALVISAENLMAGDQQHQDLAQRGGDPNSLLPGDVVRYQLVFTNIISDSVRRVEFTDPIPEGLQYVGGTAQSDREDVVIEFSNDGGQTYGGWIQPGAQVTAEFRARLPEPGND